MLVRPLQYPDTLYTPRFLSLGRIITGRTETKLSGGPLTI